jgi:hypothetical protein
MHDVSCMFTFLTILTGSLFHTRDIPSSSQGYPIAALAVLWQTGSILGPRDAS